MLFSCFFFRFVNAQVYFGVSLGSVMLGGNRYLNFFLTSLVEIPGNAFAIYAMNRLVPLLLRNYNWPITLKANNAMNQSELAAKI